MASKFQIRENAALHWPSQCVCCGAPATTRARAHAVLSAGIGLSILGPTIKHHTKTLEFPICRRHRIGVLAKRLCYFLSFLVLVGCWGAAYVMVAGNHKDYLVAALSFLIGTIPLGVFLYCEFTAPVQISTRKRGHICIAIRNTDYAQLFAKANEALL